MNVAHSFDFQLSDAIYQLDSTFRVFHRAEQGVERGIEDAPLLQLLRGCSDLSTSSGDLLRRAFTDGFAYEMSPFTANIARALDLSTPLSILEIGSCAGGLTRYLAEQGHHVTAVESTPLLAACTAERCRDLSNVRVYLEKIERLELEARFDLVIWIDPVLSMPEEADPLGVALGQVSNLLKPTGSLVFGVGNPLFSMGESIARFTPDARRGLSVPLGTLRQTLERVGFQGQDSLMAFPHHAAPMLLVHPAASQEQGVRWERMVSDTFQVGSSTARQQLASWWTAAAEAGTPTPSMAPGFVVIAHRHRVHQVLWNGWGAKRFSIAEEGNDARFSNAEANRVQAIDVNVDDAGASAWIGNALRPHVITVESLERQLTVAKRELQEVAIREGAMASTFARGELKLRGELAQQRAQLAELSESKRVADEKITELSQLNETLTCERDHLLKVKERLESNSAQLTSRIVSLEDLATTVMARYAGSERQLKEVRASWSWRTGQMLRRIFGS